MRSLFGSWSGLTSLVWSCTSKSPGQLGLCKWRKATATQQGPLSIPGLCNLLKWHSMFNATMCEKTIFTTGCQEWTLQVPKWTKLAGSMVGGLTTHGRLVYVRLCWRAWWLWRAVDSKSQQTCLQCEKRASVLWTWWNIHAVKWDFGLADTAHRL